MSTTSALHGWRRWAPDLAGGLAVLALGLFELLALDVSYYTGDPRPGLLALVMILAASVALVRRFPAVSLGLVWGMCAIQVMAGVQILAVELAIAAVAFGVARWGRVPTLVASGLSIPAAALVVVTWLQPDVLWHALDSDSLRPLLGEVMARVDRWEVAGAMAGAAVLGVPWLAGLALRFWARARQSQASQVVAEAERDQAEEIARLREGQARLARDVHDVVGHSLAVILAQAESGQYLPDEPERLKDTLATIARSARTSLRDVRQVLAQPSGPGAAPPSPGRFDELVEAVRATGQEVLLDEVGTPRPLPPDLEVVAHRVMQEMLTNAVRHGRRDRPIHVERHWPQAVYERDLRLEVSNVVPQPPAAEETQPLHAVGVGTAAATGTVRTEGSGITGMQRRVEAVGGRLDVRHRAGADGATFTTTAWVPVRA